MSIEEDIKNLIEESNKKIYYVYSILDKSQIGYIETIYDLREGMVINFETKAPKKKDENIFSNEEYIDYKVKIVSFELDAVDDLKSKREEMKCYVRVLNSEKRTW